MGGSVRWQRHKKILKYAKGFFGRGKSCFRIAVNRVHRAWAFEFRDRKNKKREFRRAWIQRVNAASREHNVPYSRFICGLQTVDCAINRKMLAELAVYEPYSFRSLTDAVKQQPIPIPRHSIPNHKIDAPGQFHNQKSFSDYEPWQSDGKSPIPDSYWKPSRIDRDFLDGDAPSQRVLPVDKPVPRHLNYWKGRKRPRTKQSKIKKLVLRGILPRECLADKQLAEHMMTELWMREVDNLPASAVLTEEQRDELTMKVAGKDIFGIGYVGSPPGTHATNLKKKAQSSSSSSSAEEQLE